MSEEYIASTIQVDIPSFSEKFVDQTTATLFEIHLFDIYSNTKWAMDKQFKDFEQLEQHLIKVITKVPELKGKSIFKVTAFDEINKRKMHLLNFLKACCVRKDIMSNEHFKEFLELDKHSPELSFHSQVKLSEFKDLPLAVQEFIYLEKEQVIIITGNEMDFYNRLQADVTNVTLPWEKKRNGHVSVGVLMIFKATFDPNQGHSFTRVFARSYTEQVGALNYDEGRMIISIGLDKGRVILYNNRTGANYSQFESMSEYKPHKGRVTGVAYNCRKGYIYSCSTDKSFIACEINYLEAPNEVKVGACGYSRLIYDNPNERIFLGTDLGDIEVYLTSSFPPTLVNQVSTKSGHSLRSFWIDNKKGFLFSTCQNGMISIVELGQPKKEKFIREISHFGGGAQLTSITYHSSASEIITGDKNGRITIWSTRKGESIYAWEAHSGGVTHLCFEESSRILLSSGEDTTLKTWKLPLEWINKDVQRYEENEIRNMSDTQAMIKLQKALERPEDYNSDEDSLNGWDYFAL